MHHLRDLASQTCSISHCEQSEWYIITIVQQQDFRYKMLGNYCFRWLFYSHIHQWYLIGQKYCKNQCLNRIIIQHVQFPAKRQLCKYFWLIYCKDEKCIRLKCSLIRSLSHNDSKKHHDIDWKVSMCKNNVWKL